MPRSWNRNFRHVFLLPFLVWCIVAMIPIPFGAFADTAVYGDTSVHFAVEARLIRLDLHAEPAYLSLPVKFLSREEWQWRSFVKHSPSDVRFAVGTAGLAQDVGLNYILYADGISRSGAPAAVLFISTAPGSPGTARPIAVPLDDALRGVRRDANQFYAAICRELARGVKGTFQHNGYEAESHSTLKESVQYGGFTGGANPPSGFVHPLTDMQIGISPDTSSIDGTDTAPRGWGQWGNWKDTPAGTRFVPPAPKDIVKPLIGI